MSLSVLMGILNPLSLQIMVHFVAHLFVQAKWDPSPETIENTDKKRSDTQVNI